jgi:hypothetical protein
VRKIDLHENAVDQGEPQCHEDIEAAEDYAIDYLLEGDGQHDRCLKPLGRSSIVAISIAWPTLD